MHRTVYTKHSTTVVSNHIIKRLLQPLLFKSESLYSVFKKRNPFSSNSQPLLFKLLSARGDEWQQDWTSLLCSCAANETISNLDTLAKVAQRKLIKLYTEFHGFRLFSVYFYHFTHELHF